MNKTKQTKKLTAFLLTLALIVTTVFGLCSFPVSAADVPAAADSLRFKQVEAGEDFAIGLTFGGELYGWSLLDSRKDVTTVNSNNPTSLGNYYPGVPTRIDYTKAFVKKYSDSVVLIGAYTQSYPQSGDTYESEASLLKGGANDEIKQLATTRTSAAFITNDNLIYTWGFDANTDLSTSSSGVSNNMLLRTGGELLTRTQGGSTCVYTQKSTLQPWIIDYLYAGAGSTNPSTEQQQMLPAAYGLNDNHLDSITSFSGGEYGYALSGLFSDNETKIVAWGQEAYMQLGTTVSNMFGTKKNIAFVAAKAGDTVFYGGGTLIKKASGGGLSVSGKNFYINNTSDIKAVSDDGFNRTADLPLIVPLVSGTGENADSDRAKRVRLWLNFGTDSKVYNNYAVLPTYADMNVAGMNVTAKTSGDKYSFASNYADTAPSGNYSTVSMGAGFGYYIDGNSKIQAFGDKSKNKDGVPSDDAKAVTAGKVLSGGTLISQLSAYGAMSSDDGRGPGTLVGTADGTTYTLDNSYVDGADYISGAILEDGDVQVWSNNAEAASLLGPSGALSAYGVSKTGGNTIVSLGAGYGNNLFAISSLGRVYRITYSDSAYAVSLYDTFYDNGTEVSGWGVVGGSVEFKEGYCAVANNVADPNVQAIITADGLSGQAIDGKSGNTDNVVASEDKLVDRKLSGDAFRIMLPKTDDGIPVKMSAEADYTNNADSDIASRINSANKPDNQVRFYWYEGNTVKSSALEYEQIKSYADVTFIVDSSKTDSSAVTVRVRPLRSTGDYVLRMEFAVGRYDSYQNNTALGSGDADGFAFYDFKRVAVDIGIANTKAVQHSVMTGENESQDTLVPLLDPNNIYNNTYSIASMDVSSGFSALADRFAAVINGINNDSALSGNEINSEIIGLITAADSGFPAQSKIASGNLDYYNNNAANVYNDKYLYLASDHDGDIVRFGLFGNSGIYDSDGRISYAAATVKVDIDISGYLSDSPDTKEKQIAALKNYFTDNADNFKMYFANVYGFTAIALDDTAGAEKLSVSYQVVRITANKSTGNVKYGNEGAAIDDPDTSFASLGSVYANYVAQTEMSAPAFGIAQKQLDNPNLNTAPVIPVFSQASLILDKGRTGDDYVYGKPNTEYNYKSQSLTVGGANNGTFRLSVTDIVGITDNMAFAYKGSSSDAQSSSERLDAFVKSFNPDLYDVTAQRTNISFTPKTSGTMTFSLYLKRYSGSATFLYGGEESEIIKLNFTVKTVMPTFGKKPDASDTYASPINGVTRVKISDRLNVPSDYAQSSAFAVRDCQSSDESVLKATYENGELVLTPGVSGKARVFYSVSLYDTTVSDSFSVTVTTMSVMDDSQTVYIINEKEITFSSLSDFLKSSNESLADEDITLDYVPTSPDNLPFYFQRFNEGAWVSATLDEVGFLRSAELTSVGAEDRMPQSLTLTMGTFDSSQSDPGTRVVVRFTAASKKYEVAFRIQPASKTLMDKNGILEVEIVKDENVTRITSNDNSTHSGVAIETDSSGLNWLKITKEYIIDVYNASLTGDTANMLRASSCSIARVKAGDSNNDSSEYIDVKYETGYVAVYPKYPTVGNTAGDNCVVQVSVKTGSSDSDDDVMLFSLYVRVSGIDTVLTKDQYQVLFIAVFFSTLGVLFIIFMIRLGVYWKKKADQRRIIRKNQLLIKMRDKVHNKTETVSRQQIVRTKLKMEDPKYAKMFNEMRKDKEAETGIALDNSVVATKAENRVKIDKAAKKKKGGKKSIEELKAELEAKRAAFSQMQMGDIPAMPMDDVTSAPMFDASAYNGELSRDDVDSQIKAKIENSDILLDAEVVSDDVSGGDDNNSSF